MALGKATLAAVQSDTTATSLEDPFRFTSSYTPQLGLLRDRNDTKRRVLELENTQSQMPLNSLDREPTFPDVKTIPTPPLRDPILLPARNRTLLTQQAGKEKHNTQQESNQNRKQTENENRKETTKEITHPHPLDPSPLPLEMAPSPVHGTSRVGEVLVSTRLLSRAVPIGALTIASLLAATPLLAVRSGGLLLAASSLVGVPFLPGATSL